MFPFVKESKPIIKGPDTIIKAILTKFNKISPLIK